jgi:hypothetical protein
MLMTNPCAVMAASKSPRTSDNLELAALSWSLQFSAPKNSLALATKALALPKKPAEYVAPL